MAKRELFTRGTDQALTPQEIARYGQGWILDGQMRSLSTNTIDHRRRLLQMIGWFLTDRELPQCGTMELRAFLAYCAQPQAGGRWGNPKVTGASRSSSVNTRYAYLRSFFSFLVEEGILDANPMDAIRRPKVVQEQIVPFSEDQVRKMLAATKKTALPERDEAIVLFLLDTGVRTRTPGPAGA